MATALASSWPWEKNSGFPPPPRLRCRRADCASGGVCACRPSDLYMRDSRKHNIKKRWLTVHSGIRLANSFVVLSSFLLIPKRSMQREDGGVYIPPTIWFQVHMFLIWFSEMHAVYFEETLLAYVTMILFMPLEWFVVSIFNVHFFSL